MSKRGLSGVRTCVVLRCLAWLSDRWAELRYFNAWTDSPLQEHYLRHLSIASEFDISDTVIHIGSDLVKCMTW